MAKRICKGVKAGPAVVIGRMYRLCMVLALLPGMLVGQEQYDTPGQTVGLDHFGRTFETIGGYKPSKQVGIFYWPWIGQPYASGVYDATVISAMTDGLKLLYDFKYLNDSISPSGQAHFWSEPLWGYYNSADEWVIRRQIAMLTTAGIDFIVFDLTNRVTYRQVYEKVLHIIEEFIDRGWSPPRVVFYTHSQSFATTWQLFEDLYRPGLFPKAWYRVGGKPMIIAYTREEDDIAEAGSRGDTSYRPVPYSQELRDFFYFKKPQWPSDPVYEDGFPWVEWTYPQPLHGNIMSVSVASHPQVPMSRSITSGWVNWGRGWDPETQQNRKEAVDIGGFFQKQWDHAFEVDPDTVFIGGWNEWVAYKQPYGDEYMLCDAADKEYSRDIEPMRGGYEDAFYIQMIRNIRKYKGLPDTGPVHGATTIHLPGNTGQWAQVKAIYQNLDPGASGRDHFGVTGKLRYTLAPPANNLQEVRVAHDADYFYFLVKAAAPFISTEGSSGFQLLLGTGAPAIKGWNGYEYCITVNHNNDRAIVNRLDTGYRKTVVASADVSVKGNLLQLRIPRGALKAGDSLKQLYFKVADGVKHPADIMDYYVTGSALPMGRLSYLYRMADH